MDKDIENKINKGRKDADSAETIDPDDAAEIVADQLASLLFDYAQSKRSGFKKLPGRG